MANKEIRRILELWDTVNSAGGEAILATVVKTQGSSYRVPGARMLLTPDGRRAGSVSGGCLEEELSRKAWWFTQQGPVVKRYDTTAEGEIAGPFGLGCNGIIYVGLERVSRENCRIFDTLRRVAESRQPAQVTHEISPDGVDRFVETLLPPMRLLIFGAGDDAIPVTELAAHMGWETHVFDGRAHYARQEKFPMAARVTVRPTGADLPIPVDPWTAAVVMSHSLTQDQANLQELAALQLPYLGVLGPRSRTAKLLEGVSPQSPIFSPMGLDLGTDGPEQVALAVIAEIQSVMNGRLGGQLRQLEGSIHQCA